MIKILRIGSRGSQLALIQTRWVVKQLKRHYPSVLCRIILIQTKGDRIKSQRLLEKAGTGVFTKALEQGLLSRKIDAAIHSLKDLPTLLPKRLTLAAVPKREDTHDVILSKKGYTFEKLPHASTVGTTAPRRRLQLLIKRPDLRVVEIHGNLDTRVRKVLKTKEVDAIVIAKAGLNRIGRYQKYAKTLTYQTMLPAPGQGALAVETLRSNREVTRLFSSIHDPLTHGAVLCERSFLKTLEGGCRVPAGALATLKKNKIKLEAIVLSPKEPAAIKGFMTGKLSEAEKIGNRLARLLVREGAQEFVRQARSKDQGS